MTNSPDTVGISIRRSSLRQGGLIVLLVAVLIVLGLIAGLLFRALTPSDPLASAINANEYQAVFLNNGQVYFGKLSAPGGDFYYLTKVYYLASQVSPQGGHATTRTTLVKLGKEIHGPEDKMIINRADILFVENLKPSGQVSRAIQAASGS